MTSIFKLRFTNQSYSIQKHFIHYLIIIKFLIPPTPSFPNLLLTGMGVGNWIGDRWANNLCNTQFFFQCFYCKNRIFCNNILIIFGWITFSGYQRFYQYIFFRRKCLDRLINSSNTYSCRFMRYILRIRIRIFIETYMIHFNL